MRKSISIVVALTLLATACGGGTGEDAPDNSTSTTSTTQTTLSADSTTTSSTIAIGAGSQTTSTSTPVSTTAETGSTTTTIPRTTTVPTEPVVLTGSSFGGYEIGLASRDEVVGFVRGFFGNPSRERNLVDEEYTTCPSGSDETVGWFDELILVFASDVFSGYLWSTADLPFATPEGLQVGFLVPQLLDLYPQADIMETTLGWEFFDEDSGLQGFVTGPSAVDTVLSIGARDICAFR